MAMSSTKNRTKMVMSEMPSTQSYSVIGPVRQGSVSASLAGARRWIKAVAMITPDPKYLAMKKDHSGTLTPRWR